MSRRCETDGCDTILSVYNPDTVCATCWEAVPLEVKFPDIKIRRLLREEQRRDSR